MTIYNHGLIILCFIISLCSISAQRSSLIKIGNEIQVWKAAAGSINIINMEDMETKLLAYSSNDQKNEDTEVTTNLRSRRGQSPQHHPHLRTVRLADQILA